MGPTKISLTVAAATVLALGITAFATKTESLIPKSKDKRFVDPVYFIHTGTAANQRQTGQYSQTATPQGTCNLQDISCWLKVTDVFPVESSDGVIDVNDFNTVFDSIDGHRGGTANQSLDDETELSGTYEKKEN